MTIQEILKKTYLEYELSPLDAGILLSLAVGKPKEYVLAHPEKKMTKLQINKFENFAKRRFAGEPVAYITRKKAFFGLDFLVNKNVLIPRPETELLVECTLEKILNKEYGIPDVIIDVGTGSGNIIASIAKNIPGKIKRKINLYAIDISEKSLQVAKKNAKKHEIEKEIKFAQSDLLEYFLNKKNKFKNILIIANLPYVSPEIYQRNKKNLEYEPKRALFSREKGLSHYKKLLKQVCSLLTIHCSLILEFSPEQKTELGRIIRGYLPKSKVKFHKDLAGKWRLALLSF